MSLVAREYPGDNPPSLSPPNFKAVRTFTNETIYYDDDSHSYRTLDGEAMVSGSQFAKQFSKPFDRGMALTVTSRAWGVKQSIIAEIWEMNGDISRGYGTALHKALELAHKHWRIGETIKQKKKDATENYALPKMPHLRKAVELFGKTFGFNGLPELFVSDSATKRVGQIDRLEIVDDIRKVCRVQDYKTTTKMDKEKIREYQYQMSFYADILKTKGWTVEALDLFAWDGEQWERIVLTVLDINGKEV